VSCVSLRIGTAAAWARPLARSRFPSPLLHSSMREWISLHQTDAEIIDRESRQQLIAPLLSCPAGPPVTSARSAASLKNRRRQGIHGRGPTAASLPVLHHPPLIDPLEQHRSIGRHDRDHTIHISITRRTRFRVSLNLIEPRLGLY
jgi:hypothetical protein